MARLIDTSIFVEMERHRIPLSVLAAGLNGEPVAVASITGSELLVGVYRAGNERNRAQRQTFVETVLSEFDVLAFDLDVARTHARISVELAAAGQAIGSHDLLIAATAVTWGYEVLTHNVRHFERVRGLAVSRPTW